MICAARESHCWRVREKRGRVLALFLTAALGALRASCVSALGPLYDLQLGPHRQTQQPLQATPYWVKQQNSQHAQAAEDGEAAAQPPSFLLDARQPLTWPTAPAAADLRVAPSTADHDAPIGLIVDAATLSVM